MHVPTETLPLKRVRPATLADSVYESLLEAILRGRFPAGTELSEVALGAELGVSRTPVHEALGRLTVDGLVESMTNRQVRVTSPGPSGIREIYEMRLLLEPAAAQRAATRLSAAQLESLRDAASFIANSTDRDDWPARAIDFDIRFHDVLAAASQHERLAAEITKYRRLVRALCRATGSRGNLWQAFREHLAILDALEARDGGAAAAAMAAHIEARLQAVLDELPDEAGSVSFDP
jgi:DNA-binding GntR family transcriptional regulator